MPQPILVDFLFNLLLDKIKPKILNHRRKKNVFFSLFRIKQLQHLSRWHFYSVLVVFNRTIFLRNIFFFIQKFSKFISVSEDSLGAGKKETNKQTIRMKSLRRALHCGNVYQILMGKCLEFIQTHTECFVVVCLHRIAFGYGRRQGESIRPSRYVHTHTRQLERTARTHGHRFKRTRACVCVCVCQRFKCHIGDELCLNKCLCGCVCVWLGE